MKRLLLLLVFSLPVLAQTFTAFEVYPSTAVKGVTQKIRLRSEDGFLCINEPVWCGIASITVGGVPASFTFTELTAETEVTLPELPAGTVADVVVTDRNGNIRRRNAAIRIVDPNAPYSAEAFDRVLIPVIYEGSGLNESRWTTDVWVMNGATYDIPFLRGPVPQLAREQIRKINTFAPNGFVLYPAKGGTDEVSVNVLVRDLSKQSEAFGTELPAVRERDFETRRVLLLNVPSDPKYRLTLRVYSFDPLPGMNTVQYWLHTLESGEQATFWTAQLNPPRHENEPWSATIDLMTAHPEIVNKGPLSLTVKPVRTDLAGPRFWAFVTVTNNQTQHVTAITPNP